MLNMKKHFHLVMDRTATFYASPSYVHRGAGVMPVFSGARRQRGGSIFGALKNFFMPVIKGIGKSLAKRGTQEAIGLAKDVVGDAFLFKDVGQSIKERGKKRALNFSKYAADTGLDALENMIGSGKRRRRRTNNLRKRKRSTKRTKTRPKKKRRRVTKSLF